MAAVQSGIDAFAADVPQNDDITMLCLRYNSHQAPQQMELL